MDNSFSTVLFNRQPVYKNKFILLFTIAFSGALLGFADKFSGNVSWVQFDTTIEFWLLLITILAVYSSTKWMAALHSTLFLLAMVFSYYITYYLTLGFIPMRLFQGWILFALLSSIYGFVLWHAKKKGSLAAFVGAIPIAILLQRGYYFIPDLLFRQPPEGILLPYWGIDILRGFNFLGSLLLFFIFFKATKSPKLLLLFTLIFFFLFKWIGILDFLHVF